jgi:CubicO group peptidase (beta-lactamase class C family)
VLVQVAGLAPSPQRAQEFISSVLPSSSIPGLSVAVVQQGKVLYTGGFGVKQADKPATGDNVVTADTLFEIGSCTKTFIAMGLAQFVNTGAIDWDTPVVTVLDWFKGFDAYMTKNVNIGDLLAHRTGLGDHDGDILWLLGGVSDEEELVRRIQSLPLRTSLRETFMYSNMGFEIAAVVLAKLAGVSWAQYLAGNVWTPLGMKSTASSINVPPEKRASLSGGHYVWYELNATERILPFDYYAPTTPKLSPGFAELGAGSIISSANDYAKWLIFLLDSPNATVATMESGQMIVPESWATLFMMLKQEGAGNALAAGFGFDVVGHTFYNQRFFTKGGDTLFHKTRTGFLPDFGLGVSLMANVEGDYVTEIYVDGIRNALLQIYLGDSDAQVQAAWQPLQTLIQQNRQQLPSVLPNNTLSLPLTSGTLIINYRLYVAPQEQVSIISKCETLGLAPFQAVGSYVGAFSNPYYGTAVVVALPGGLLSLSYGTFAGALCRLSTAVEAVESFLWPNGTMLSGLFSSPYIPVEFGSFSGGAMQNLNLIGIDFNRNPAVASVKHVKRPSFFPSPLL